MTIKEKKKKDQHIIFETTQNVLEKVYAYQAKLSNHKQFLINQLAEMEQEKHQIEANRQKLVNAASEIELSGFKDQESFRKFNAATTFLTKKTNNGVLSKSSNIFSKLEEKTRKVIEKAAQRSMNAYKCVSSLS